MRDEVTEELEGLPDTVDKVETEYPKRYLLSLYKIFFEVSNSDNEKEKLEGHILSLEDKVGTSNSRNAGDDPFSSLFDRLPEMAEQLTGKKIPKDKIPGKNDFGKMINDL